MDKTTPPFNNQQTWSQQVIEADNILAQVEKALQDRHLDLPKTPRRPDVRLIINNISGTNISFLNPGNHAKENTENIPGQGKDTAAMVMLNGNTIEEQIKQAESLASKFNLHQKGLSKDLIAALGTPDTTSEIKEIYGPSSFDAQADRLHSTAWKKANGQTIEIKPHKKGACAYGVRPPESETVFRNEIVLFIKGTTTTAEAIENTGMCIAVSEDWKTKEKSTRPIVPSVAQEFYGEHFADIPVVTTDTMGNVQTIDLKNGSEVIHVPSANTSTPELNVPIAPTNT